MASETEQTAEPQTATETKKPGKGRATLRLAAELVIVAWGLIVCNLSQIFGGTLAFTDNLQSLQTGLVFATLFLPLLALLLIIPVTGGKLRLATVVSLVVLSTGVVGLVSDISTAKANNKLSTGLLQNMLTLFAADHMAVIQTKDLKKDTKLVLYAATDPKAGIGTMAREETTVAPGMRFVKLLRKPSEKLFN